MRWGVHVRVRIHVDVDVVAVHVIGRVVGRSPNGRRRTFVLSVGRTGSSSVMIGSSGVL